MALTAAWENVSAFAQYDTESLKKVDFSLLTHFSYNLEVERKL